MIDRLLGADPTGLTGGDALAGLMRASLRVGVVVALVIVLGAAMTRGVPGAVTALVTAAVLIGLHVGSGLATARLARGRPMAMPGITMAALLLRLAVYGLLVAVFSGNDAIDVPVLAVTVVTLTISMLTVESVLVVRHSRHWWADTTQHTAAGPAEPASTAATERTAT